MAMGTVGLSATPGDPIPSDLEAIYQGGEFFLERVKAMDKRTAYAKAALADLNVGQDIVASHAAAQKALAEANQAKADANQVLYDAQQKAAALVAGAEAKAAEIVKSANDASAYDGVKSSEIRAAADAYALETRNKAKEILADATAKQSTVNDQIENANKSQTAADRAKLASDNAKIAYDAATQAANEAKEAYLTKIAKLQAVIGAES